MDDTTATTTASTPDPIRNTAVAEHVTKAQAPKTTTPKAKKTAPKTTTPKAKTTTPKAKKKTAPKTKGKPGPKARVYDVRGALKGGPKTAKQIAKVWKVEPSTVKRVLEADKSVKSSYGDFSGKVGRRPLIFTLK